MKTTATGNVRGKTSAHKSKIKKRDHGVISFQGHKYGKGRFVQAVVEQYVRDNPGVTMEQLKLAFPDELHHRGVIASLATAKRKSKEYTRFFIEAPIKIKDAVIAVCNDFGKNNISKFLKNVRILGYSYRMAA